MLDGLIGEDSVQTICREPYFWSFRHSDTIIFELYVGVRE